MDTRTFGFNFAPMGDGDAITIQVSIQKLRIPEIAILTIQSDNDGIELDSSDLQIFGEMCLDLSKKMQLDHEARNACPECGGMLAHHEYCSMYVKKN